MRINIKVVPNAPRDRWGEESGGLIKIYITAPPVDNKANEHLIRFLAGYFGRPRSRIRILRGLRSRIKTVEIG